MKSLNINPSENGFKLSVSDKEVPTGNVFATVKSRSVQINDHVTSTINLVDLPRVTAPLEPSSTDVEVLTVPTQNIAPIVTNTEKILNATRTYLLQQMPLVFKNAFGVAGNKDTLRNFIREYLKFQKTFTIDEKAIPQLSKNLTNELVGLGALDKLLSENTSLQKIHCIGTDVWVYETGKQPYKYSSKLGKNELNTFIKKLHYVTEHTSKDGQLRVQGTFSTFSVSGFYFENEKDASLILNIDQPLEEITEQDFITNIGSAVTLDLLKATLKSKKGVLVTGGSKKTRLQFLNLLTSMLDSTDSIHAVKRLAAINFKELFTNKPISYLSVEEMEQGFKNEGTVSIVNDFNEFEFEHLLSLGNQGRTIIATLNTPTLQSTLNQLHLMGARKQSLNETLVSKLIENTFKLHIQLDSDTNATSPKIQCISEIVSFEAKNNVLVINELFSLELDVDNMNFKDSTFPTKLLKKNGLSEALLKTFLIKGVFTENMHEIASGEIAKKMSVAAIVNKIEESANDNIENNFFHFESKGVKK